MRRPKWLQNLIDLWHFEGTKWPMLSFTFTLIMITLAALQPPQPKKAWQMTDKELQEACGPSWSGCKAYLDDLLARDDAKRLETNDR